MSILEFKGVSIGEPGLAVLSGLDFELDAGERLVVFGPSGSGKRALLKTAAGILRPAKGTVRLNGGGRRCPVGYVLRDGGLLNNMTLLQNVMLPVVYHRRMSRSEAETRAHALLEDLGVRRTAVLRPAMAPLAARRLAQLARALLAEPAVYVMESPLDEVDAESMVAVWGVMDRIRDDKDACAVLATGSPKPYLDWGSRFLMVSGDKVRQFDGREALMRDKDPDVRVFLSGRTDGI